MNIFIIALLIFLYRLADCAAETIRIILLVNKYKFIPSIISFFEVFFWVYIFNEVVSANSSLLIYFVYAAGYAVGTFFGCQIGNYVITKSQNK